MEKYLLILIVIFICVGLFLVTASKYENYKNKLSDDEKQLNEMINQVNRLLHFSPTTFNNKLIKLE